MRNAFEELEAWLNEDRMPLNSVDHICKVGDTIRVNLQHGGKFFHVRAKNLEKAILNALAIVRGIQ